MTKMKMNRIALVTALVSVVLGAAAVAAAHPAGQRCEGKGASTPAERAERQAERFQKADKNGDGFLTKDEVGDRRWEHLKVADANGDGKLTKAEIQKAHEDGKLGRHGHGRGGEKKQS